jgi:hypothetical protein
MIDNYFYISKETGNSSNTDKQCTAIFNYIDKIYNQYKNIKDNEWSKIYAGMGCFIYLTGEGDKIKCFFLHSDDYGQYIIDNTSYVEDMIRDKIDLSTNN